MKADTPTAEADAAARDDADRTPCPNCGSTQVAAFCADCGQDQETPRKRWRAHLEEIISTYTELDSATLKSLVMVIARPGKLSELNLQNRAGSLVSPLKLFLIVVVLYSIFFAFSPIKYGQFYIALDSEWYGESEDASNGGPPAWEHNLQLYAPPVSDPVSPGFHDALESGAIDKQTLKPAWIIKLLSNPARMARFEGRVSTLAIYLPLAIIPVLMIANGYMFRRRYFLFDHFYLALEVATVMILIILLAAAVTSILYMRGVVMDEATPTLIIELPLLITYLSATMMRFYRLSFWRGVGNGFLVFVLFGLVQEFSFYPLLTLLGWTV